MRNEFNLTCAYRHERISGITQTRVRPLLGNAGRLPTLGRGRRALGQVPEAM
jgi:hypothetical protein